jgi:hypothetical protein
LRYELSPTDTILFCCLPCAFLPLLFCWPQLHVPLGGHALPSSPSLGGMVVQGGQE